MTTIMTTETPDFDVFTSFRYDPKLATEPFNNDVNGEPIPYLLLPYHVERLIKAAKKFGWDKAVESLTSSNPTASVKKVCDKAVEECNLPDKENGLGLRVLLNQEGELYVQPNPTRPLFKDPLQAARFNPDDASADIPLPIFDVYVDTEITPSSDYTSYKTTHRPHYTSARERAGIMDRKGAKEVILHNERGEVTEGSVTNVSLWRNGGWVTPPDSTGGLPGTVRRYLLERGLVKEGVIHVEDIHPGDWVLLTNGFIIAVVGRVVG